MSHDNAASDWQQISVTTTRAGLAEAVFEQFDASAISVLDADDEPTIELTPNAGPVFAIARVVGLFDAAAPFEAVTRALKDALGSDITVQVQPLAQQDWANAWLAHHPPLHFGDRLWVAPHDTSVDTADDAVIIRLEPGLAFGTGTHPTTALCLRWLAQANLSGCSVLDYGCGSGILAIAAARLGAADVIAVDTDKQATRATRDNAETNAVSDVIRTPAIETLDAQREYDIVLANILAGPLVELAATLTHHTRPNGRLVLSGLLSRHVASVQGAYNAHFSFAQPAQDNDWVRLDGVRMA